MTSSVYFVIQVYRGFVLACYESYILHVLKSFLNQARAWFLKITSVRMYVCVCVCVCVCLLAFGLLLEY